MFYWTLRGWAMFQVQWCRRHQCSADLEESATRTLAMSMTRNLKTRTRTWIWNAMIAQSYCGELMMMKNLKNWCRKETWRVGSKISSQAKSHRNGVPFFISPELLNNNIIILLSTGVGWSIGIDRSQRKLLTMPLRHGPGDPEIYQSGLAFHERRVGLIGKAAAQAGLFRNRRATGQSPRVPWCTLMPSRTHVRAT